MQYVPFQALSTITRCIKYHNYTNLRGLISDSGREKLIQEVEVEWSEFEKNNVEVTAQDLDSSVIERINIDEQRSAANIRVTLLAVKENIQPPILLKFGLTFSKDYLDEQAGWIVTEFKLLQLGKLDESQVFK